MRTVFVGMVWHLPQSNSSIADILSGSLLPDVTVFCLPLKGTICFSRIQQITGLIFARIWGKSVEHSRCDILKPGLKTWSKSCHVDTSMLVNEWDQDCSVILRPQVWKIHTLISSFSRLVCRPVPIFLGNGAENGSMLSLNYVWGLSEGMNSQHRLKAS